MARNEARVKLFGPILFYDMVRMGRRSRYILLRCLYALLLLALMYPVYQSFLDPAGPFVQYEDPAKKLTLFGETFFYVFIAAQFIVTVLVTPAYVGGAIADEKHNRTLEYLLATDLRNREVVLGKLASRLANLALFLFTGLPVLSLNLLFGGVSVELLICGFAATAVTMLSLASLSILQSVYAKRVRDALIRTYAIMIGYFALWGLIFLFREFLRLDGQTPAAVFEIINGFLAIYNTGNPTVTLYELVTEVKMAGAFGTKPFELLGSYSLFHGIVALWCLTLAIVRLRAVYLRQAFGSDRSRNRRNLLVRAVAFPLDCVRRILNIGGRKANDNAVPEWKRNDAKERAHIGAVSENDPSRLGWRERLRRPLWRRRRRPCGERPMLWKEYYFERVIRLGVLGELAFVLLALVCFIPMFITSGVAVLEMMQQGYGVDSMFHGRMNQVIRLVGTALAGFVIVGTGVRAASSIGAEQNRQTFETLMATPLSNFDILAAKWLGSALSQRWMFALLLTVWVLATVALGLHWLALPLVLLVLGVLVAFVTSLGLALATVSKTSGRAATTLVIFLMALSGLPWLIMDDEDNRPAANILSPPRLLYAAAFWQGDYDQWRSGYWQKRVNPPARRPGFRYPPRSTALLRYERWQAVLLPTGGLILYAVAALGLWLLALGQFRKRCGRVIQRSGGSESRRLPMQRVETAQS
jgi:ABC-type Na+ efflux pump permease subunit